MLHSHICHPFSILTGIPRALLEAGDDCRWHMKGQWGALYKGDSFHATDQKQDRTLIRKTENGLLRYDSNTEGSARSM